MDHVINSLRQWLDIYEEQDNEGWKDETAIKCIKKALKELNKYYDYDSNK